MRRTDREITDYQDMEGILSRARVMCVGMIDGDKPYVVPMHFCWQKEEDRYVVYAHCAKEGRKIEVIKKNPNVFFEADVDNGIFSMDEDVPCTYGDGYECVMADGVAQFIPAGEEKNHALELLMVQQTGRAFTINDQMASSVEVLKITLANMTAKRCVKK